MCFRRPQFSSIVARGAVILYLSVCGFIDAFAATITYTTYQAQYYDCIYATNPNNITALAGQIKLTGVSGDGFPSTVLAWCVDIYHLLSRSGTLTVETPQPQQQMTERSVKSISCATLGGLHR